MKTVFEHIEHIKGKPHHIRKRVAFSVAGVVTGFVALIWIVGSLGTGSFALGNASFADSAGQVPVQIVDRADINGLAGVAATVSDENIPAHIEIVDTTPTASKQKQVEQTTLPF